MQFRKSFDKTLTDLNTSMNINNADGSVLILRTKEENDYSPARSISPEVSLRKSIDKSAKELL